MVKEIQFTPIKSEPEEKKEKPVLNQHDMTSFAQIVISALVTYLLIEKGLFDGNRIQLYLAVSFMIFILTVVQYLISKKLLRWAKRKATRKQVTNRKFLHGHYNKNNKKNKE